MFCKFCGTQINDNAIFCCKCGSKIKTTEEKTLVVENALPFKQEFKKYIFLFVLPFIAIALILLRSYFFNSTSDFADYGDIFTTILFYSNQYVNSIFYGLLAYIGIKRSFKFSMLCIFPYIFIEVAIIYPFVYKIPIAENISNFECLMEYFGMIVLPFIILGVMQLLKSVMKNSKAKILKSVLATLITIILFSIWLIASYYSNMTNFYHYIFENTYRFVIGISVVNILLNLIYKAE